jgi:hypothetical protein
MAMHLFFLSLSSSFEAHGLTDERTDLLTNTQSEKEESSKPILMKSSFCV